MKTYATNLLNNKGLTLIELLLGMVISSVVIVILYSIFISGINNYKAIGDEALLRNEADYILATILNKVYDTPLDKVKQESEDKIILQETQMIDFEDDGILEIKPIEEADATNTSIELVDNNILINDVIINSERFQILTDKSSLKACAPGQSECKDGIFDITLTLKYADIEENSRVKNTELKVTSSFGF